MSRMYHNEPLGSIPVKTHHVSFEWDRPFSGKGVIIEGTITDRSRNVVIDNTQNKTRYFVLHVNITKCHRRQFNAEGTEIEPNFSDTGKVRKGFLHSSYKTVAKGETDLLTRDQTRSCLATPDIDRLVQTSKADLALWIEESHLDKIELSNGDNIRVKTKADCPFIESLAKLDTQSSTVSNYAGGDQVGGSWTDKVMNVKTNTQDKLPQDLVEGVDEDEWDD